MQSPGRNFSTSAAGSRRGCGDLLSLCPRLHTVERQTTTKDGDGKGDGDLRKDG